MATISFAAQVNPVYLDQQMGSATGTIAATDTEYSWTTISSMAITLEGTDFADDPPTAGTVTTFSFQTTYDPTRDADMAITGLSFDLGEFFSTYVGYNGNEQRQRNFVWRTVLGGDDTVDFGSGAALVSFGGDGYGVEGSQSLFSGTDAMTGTVADGSSISGDFLQVALTAKLYGGDDTINLVTIGTVHVVGDAILTSGGVVGGDDKITLAGASGFFVSGDVETVQYSAFVRGGDDTIEIGVDGQYSASAFGESNSVYGIVLGGDDSITVSANFQLDASLYGDVGYLQSGAYLEGGNDTLRGGAGSNYLYGDAGAVGSGAYLKGGDDTLYGGASSDTLSGDWGTAASGSTVVGGNDQIYGYAGADLLYGNGGDDLLNGGSGEDDLNGGMGKDIFVFDAALSTGADTVNDFASADDTFDIDNAVFKGLKLGTLAKKDFKLIASATSTVGVDTSDRILYDQANGDLYFDRDGSAKKFDRVVFAHLVDGTVINNTDFHII